MKTAASQITVTLCAMLAIGGAFTAANAQQRRPSYNYSTGQELYEHICQGCHMPGGAGATGAGSYPRLASDENLNAPLYPVLLILQGQKAMPSFSDLSDEQISAVTNYIRSNFGNGYKDQVTPDQVRELRAYAVAGEAQRPG